MARHPGRPPIINAPPWVTGLALALLVAHGARVLMSTDIQDIILWNTALFPERFWGWWGASLPPGAPYPYPNALLALATLFTTAFVHSGWAHVGVNAAMLVGVGKPVHDMLDQPAPGERRRGGALFLLVFMFSVAGGSVAHLIAHFPDGMPAIGASGGVSGLIAAVLLGQGGPQARLLSRPFLTASAVFAVANIVLALIGPAMLGGGIAWQAHMGGYFAGALIFRLLMWRRVRAQA
ncbi:rhomboid family intramembrane serine protease [Hyphomonas johnsonii]|jgi:membrane associated rhomboid family serine protease|uniref:S54 family peptidase n=1 Tax=Hyphomonas johnsonii MHS-2 TaxID=1280950 RepID=A0A059FTQ4_9PROT|nr:rhomboid family intramembrane serine protease [Hyphomonas johnsonii]KCZ93901.1 S54 family peptidase [Hyphomonas johnsonii MHS-2]